MRAVLDTNVIVRARPSFLGPVSELVERLVVKPHGLVLSPALLEEIKDVIGRPKLRELWRGVPGAADRFLSELERHPAVSIVSPARGPRIVSNDPDDDVVVHTAIAGRADVICTADRDLFAPDVLQFCRRNGIRVVRDEDLLSELRRSDPSA